ncbi:RdgB/HAM1 family non-canonical purine NTP pyrophosphatase [Synechococcus sp. BA-124 BA4]|uniref:RdgB/HAM1 family non-canonical purine NTP pyrophosphatase n=1 Tax=unclassified Synechococcus TaxID=2626047 RepID=UPI0018CCB4B1|nr:MULTISPECIES: RdgB/HAM1 family non-canonical purine NTP pyrophosphatase [unclassified Synechococcus]MEA5399546.1 RdgB/HAM1 family non-canonical purine NTP pyrophosphatase [Synechococcus sp. BA-124 BA4]QPN55458.1 RdgB/HAM1 family non-canonical purine NTP pyrophosphatase [Synechococcus sp. CBW1107]CAK6689880.1 dITP/XTP pyrophosphatase [Synechococcus sp. CBW1107]
MNAPAQAATPRVLVIASGNPGKIREFTALLATEGPELDLEVRGQPPGLEVEETGDSFAANARLKAEAVARITGHWALADDSGLSVEALGGAPGIHSARYAPTDPERIARLLEALEGESNRRARFTAALALADPSGQTVLEVEGVCTGEILNAPCGEGGFGYDPVFLVPEVGLSFAQMAPELKRRVGHRGRALEALLPPLRRLFADAGRRTVC